MEIRNAHFSSRRPSPVPQLGAFPISLTFCTTAMKVLAPPNGEVREKKKRGRLFYLFWKIPRLPASGRAQCTILGSEKVWIFWSVFPVKPFFFLARLFLKTNRKVWPLGVSREQFGPATSPGFSCNQGPLIQLNPACGDLLRASCGKKISGDPYLARCRLKGAAKRRQRIVFRKASAPMRNVPAQITFGSCPNPGSSPISAGENGRRMGRRFQNRPRSR